jgi:hypothetical protein
MDPLLSKRLTAAGWLGAGVAVGAVLLAGWGDRESSAASGLAASATKADLVAFTGAAPARCVFSAPGFELCGWAHRSDPAELGLPDSARDVVLVCELPLANGERAEDSCAAHAASQLPPVSAAAQESGEDAALREALHWRAEQLLARAGTVKALSHLIGDVPDSCRTGLASQTCEWTVSERKEGYGVIAAVAHAEGPIRLRCAVSLDGSDRAERSCTASSQD